MSHVAGLQLGLSLGSHLRRCQVGHGHVTGGAALLSAGACRTIDLTSAAGSARDGYSESEHDAGECGGGGEMSMANAQAMSPGPQATLQLEGVGKPTTEKRLHSDAIGPQYALWALGGLDPGQVYAQAMPESAFLSAGVFLLLASGHTGVRASSTADKFPNRDHSRHSR